MSWRDRDWARFTDEERSRLYGGGSSISPAGWVALTVAAIAICAFAYVYLPGRSPTRPAQVVYSDGVEVGGRVERLTCTGQTANTRLGIWVCTNYQILQPGQTVVRARDPGGPCGIRHVDQRAGAWVCDRVKPPRQGLPPVRPPSPQRVV